jgi:hypothetical protein
MYRDTFLLPTFQKHEPAMEAASDPNFLIIATEIARLLLQVRP